VVDAVQCAVEIQDKIETKNADVPEDRKMQLKNQSFQISIDP